MRVFRILRSRMNRRNLRAAVAAAAGALIAAACSAAPTPAAVVVYTSRSEALFKPVVDAFNKTHPEIKVTLLSGSNGQLAARLLEESANPQADVLVNSDVLNMVDLASKGVFQPNPSKVVAAVPSEYRAEDGAWAALTLRPRVIMYNTNLVKPEEVPQSVFGLTDPKWKDQVGSADSTNGALMANLAVMRSIFGEAKTSEFVQALVGNGTKFFGGHTEVRKAVGAGELKLGWVNHYYYYLSKAEGAPVGIVYPDMKDAGLIVNSTNVGIIKGAKNESAARIFVDFLLSAEGQRVFAEANFEYPVVPGVALAKGVEPLDSLKRADVTMKAMYDDLGPTRAMAQQAGLP